MCNAYDLKSKSVTNNLDVAVWTEIMKLPQARPASNVLIRRGGQGVVVVDADGVLRPETMRWGFDHPRWKLVNNARTESLNRGMWVDPMKSSRCLVPVSGFYEWQEVTKQIKQPKQPYRVWRPDSEWAWVAGLFERTASGDGHYATITTEPTDAFRLIHDRLLAVVDFETGLDFLGGGSPPRDPFSGPLEWQTCESPLKASSRKKDPPDNQGFLL